MTKYPILYFKKANLSAKILISVVLPGLLENFEKASMEVVQCPDLTKPPFHLAAKGKSIQIH